MRIGCPLHSIYIYILYNILSQKILLVYHTSDLCMFARYYSTISHVTSCNHVTHITHIHPVPSPAWPRFGRVHRDTQLRLLGQLHGQLMAGLHGLLLASLWENRWVEACGNYCCLYTCILHIYIYTYIYSIYMYIYIYIHYTVCIDICALATLNDETPMFETRMVWEDYENVMECRLTRGPYKFNGLWLWVSMGLL